MGVYLEIKTTSGVPNVETQELVTQIEVDKAIIQHQLNCGMKTEFQFLIDQLSTAKQWQLKMWSNGSGGPPGFIETFRLEVDSKLNRLSSEVQRLHDYEEQRKGAQEQQSLQATKVSRHAAWEQTLLVAFGAGALTGAVELIKYLLHH